ncbi:MAG: hypothetical protein J6K30_04030, partial [Oscillospiraceae bacterium]|nr:hypothetical protein [Oscillospiraceae bacterium]
IAIDLSNITPGQYMTDLSFGFIDTERYLYHDDVLDAFGFELEENENQQTIKWFSGSWGYTILPPIKVKQG